MIKVNTSLMVSGQLVVLIRDVVGDSPEKSYTLHRSNGQNFWYEERALVDVKKKNPKAKVFGLWQALFSSGLVDKDAPLQIVWSSTEKDYGQYLYNNKGVIQSGAVFNGLLQGLPLEAVNEEVSLETALEINATSKRLSLPLEELQSKREIAQAAEAGRRKSLHLNVMLAAILAVMFVGVDFWNQSKFESHQKKYAAITSQLASVDSEVNILLLTRLRYKPDQTKDLEKIFTLHNVLASEEVSGEINLLTPGNRVVSVKNTLSNKVRIRLLVGSGFTVSPKPNDTLVSWVSQ